MSAEMPFDDLIRQIRAGNEDAAAELLRRYEPVLRRVVRIRLLDAHLRRRCAVSDICQSVLASFFLRAALGQYQLDTPEHLVKLLATMARNKLADQARRQRRDHCVPLGDQPASALAAAGASPSQQVAWKELLGEAQRRLSEGERHLLELRQQGRGWPEIAAQLGGSPEALRKRLARAVNLVARQLGLEGYDNA